MSSRLFGYEFFFRQGTCKGHCTPYCTFGTPSYVAKTTQHGFRQGGCCQNNLLDFLDYVMVVTSSLDNHDSVDVIYLDLAKALNRIPQLLQKIDKHGISGKVLAWISELLSRRSQSLYGPLQVNLEISTKWCT